MWNNMCQRIKNRMEVLVRKLKLSEILEKLCIYLMVNFITKLPLVAKKNTILVVYDRMSKITYFIATTKDTSVEELVWLFQNNM